MVNTPVTTNNAAAADAVSAERALATGYAPADARAALRALFALDDALGQVLQTTREPLLGQMRLAWWREALARLDTAPAPAEPVLRALAETMPLRGVTGAMLSTLVDGWEALLTDPLDTAAVAAHGRARGARCFALAALALGETAARRVEAAGEGWALADLARHLSSPALAADAMARARLAFSEAFAGAWSTPWPVSLRALGALALLARADLGADLGIDLAGEPRPGSPGRVGRLLWHRLTGR